MKLEYRKMGSGAPLVILHGLYGSSDNWYSIAKALSQKFEVYLVDQRNHGRSPHSNIHNYRALSDDLHEFLTIHSITKTIILGHSMGGKTAMTFAARFPEMVESLIIVDIAPKAYKSLLSQHPHVLQHLNIMNAMLAVNLDSKHSRAEIDQEFSQYVHDNQIRNFLLKNIIRDNNGAFKWVLNVKALLNSLPNLLDGIDIDKFNITKIPLSFPALFIRGEKSDYIDNEDIANIKKYFPNAEIVTIFDAGHWVHAEQPELFLKSVMYFLEK